ncbi:hypothetical protein OC704_02365 [Sweet potato little leaf phytoplasma]|uniref:hypothetical protein n=1 Tax=Candidatus Phytoplasma australasiaticum TaxID=2754999 RepID=UPI0030E84A8E
MNRPSAKAVLIGALLLAVGGFGYLQYQAHQELAVLGQASTSHGQQLGTVIEELSPDREAVQALHRQISAQDQITDGLVTQQAQLKGSIADLAAELQAVRDEQIAQAEGAETGELASQIEALKQKVAELSAIRSRPVPVTSAPPASAKPSARQPEPPLRDFEVHGVESRAGNLFLVVSPSGVQQLSAMRLLSPGESVGTWRLDRLDTGSAVFSVSGHPAQTVSLQ